MNWKVSLILLIAITASYYLSEMDNNSYGSYFRTVENSIKSGDVFAAVNILLSAALMLYVVFALLYAYKGFTVAKVATVILFGVLLLVTVLAYVF